MLLIRYLFISTINLRVKCIGYLLGAKLAFPVISSSFWQNPLHVYETVLWFIYILIIIFVIYPQSKRQLRNEISLSAFCLFINHASITDIYMVSICENMRNTKNLAERYWLDVFGFNVVED